MYSTTEEGPMLRIDNGSAARTLLCRTLSDVLTDAIVELRRAAQCVSGPADLTTAVAHLDAALQTLATLDVASAVGVTSIQCNELQLDAEMRVAEAAGAKVSSEVGVIGARSRRPPV